MKRFCFLAFGLVLAGCGGTVTPTGSTGKPISFSITCPVSQPCLNGEQFQVYRITGQCPSPLADSIGWALMQTIAASTFTDTAVTSGVSYSYVVEGVVAGVSYSGPSICKTWEAT